MIENPSSIRIIPRLDIKGQSLIKGYQFEGYRVVGDPAEAAQTYYQLGADELLFVDNVASLYGQNLLMDLIERVTESVFIPITVTGGIRSITDALEALRHGADKVGVNTAAVKDPSLIKALSDTLGSQSVVLSVEAKKSNRYPSGYECMVNFGRDHANLDLVDWVRVGVEQGAGEVLVTSIDRDGTQNGLDFEMLERLQDLVSVPLIVSGGFHLSDAYLAAKTRLPLGIAIGASLHSRAASIHEIREVLAPK